MRVRSLKTGVLRLPARVVTVAAVAVLVGCGDSGERAVELPAGSGEESDAVLYDPEDAAAGDADVDDADVDGVVVGGGFGGGGVGGDPVEVGDGGVVGDAGASGVVAGDEGGVDSSVVVDGGGDVGVDVGVEGLVADGVVVDGGGDEGGIDGGVVVDGDAGVGVEGLVADGVVVDDGFGGLLVVGVCGWPGPFCPADESVAPIDDGGPLWRSSNLSLRRDWLSWAGRVLDLCDDHEALLVMDGQGWDDRGSAIDYGAEIDPSDMWRLLAYREHEVVVCDGARSVAPVWWCAGEEDEQLWAWLDQFLIQPARPDVWAWIESQGLDCVDATTLGRRYVYVTAWGPSRKPLGDC